MTEPRTNPPETLGILCALPEELGTLARHSVETRRADGCEILELDLSGRRALAVVSGVGLERAAHAATRLVELGARSALLVVGTCGALVDELGPGDLVHCSRAIHGGEPRGSDRELVSDSELSAAWRAQVGGHIGHFHSQLRPVTTPWKRFFLARASRGLCVADMETAAVARVAHSHGVPWAALRAVTDRAGFGTRTSFRAHYRTQSGRAADTVHALVQARFR